MKFPYASYGVDPSLALPRGIVYRPEIPVEVIGALGSETIQALVDTGSDETVFPSSLADAIGVELDYSAAGEAAAVGGHAVRLVPGRVTLQIAQSQRTYRWQAVVGFLEVAQPEDEIALLGYAGFLEFFRATFDSENRVLELEANGRLPHDK